MIATATAFFCVIFPVEGHAQVDGFQPTTVSQQAISQLAQARSLRHAGDLKGAEEILRMLVSTSPNFFNAQYNLGLVLSEQNKVRESVAVFETALRIREAESLADFTIYNTTAWAHLVVGDFDRALELLKISEANLERLQPASRGRVLNNLGLVYMYKGNREEASRYFELAKQDYGNPLAIQNLKLLATMSTSSSAKP